MSDKIYNLDKKVTSAIKSVKALDKKVSNLHKMVLMNKR